MTDWRPVVGLDVVKRRAELFDGIRGFFRERGVIEVDTPVLSAAAVTDPHIHSLHTDVQGIDWPCYLHTSPEFPMKRLLAAGSGDIYQICKVFRQGEIGRNHNPEFTLLEWYRCGYDHHQLMDEMAELLAAVAAPTAVKSALRISYHDAFSSLAGIDVEADLPALTQQISTLSKRPPDGLEDKNEWLDWAMGAYVAPQFPTDRFTFLFDYPADQAALARVRQGDPAVAERFEVFWGELELANGFHELADAEEQLVRFERENAVRGDRAMHVVPIDHRLIGALRAGLPDCAGVALGIDRLLMVLLSKQCISDVITFDVERA